MSTLGPQPGDPRLLHALAAQPWRETGTLTLRGLGLRSLPDLGEHVRHLRRVDLAGNRLTAIPLSWWDADRLETLVLAGNRISALPDEIGRLRSLAELDVSDNRLRSLPPGLADCAGLRRLDISGNRLTDLSVISAMGALQMLDAAGNRLSSLPELPPTLSVLDLSSNALDQVPPAVRSAALRRLDLSGNRLTSVVGLEGMALDVLHLDDNRLSEPPRLPHVLRLSFLGNPFERLERPVVTTADRAAQLVEQNVSGAAERGRHYFDAPTYSVDVTLSARGPTEAQRVLDLYYKRYAGLEATVRFEDGTRLNLAQLTRGTALGRTAGHTEARVEVAPTKRDLARATSFLAQAVARLDDPALVTSEGRALGVDQPGLPSPPRVVNVLLSDAAGRLLPAHRTLRVATTYSVAVDIGPVLEETVVVDPVKVPVDLLEPDSAEGHLFDVVVSSGDVEVAHTVHKLLLPPRGRSEVLVVPFETGPTPGHASVRVTVHHRNNAVQSVRVDFSVDEAGGLPGEVVGRVDYALSEDAAQAGTLPPKEVHLLTNHGGGGTHTIVVADGVETSSTSITETAAKRVLTATRDRLKRITLEADGTVSRYDEENGKPTADFVHDLKMLALSGSQLYGTVLPDVRDRLRLKSALAGHARIQVSRTTPTTFPWALVYDLPRDTGEGDVVLCPLLLHWEEERERLADYPERCPFEADHAPRNTLCPFGFWGFRHQIEQPPSVRSGTLRTSIEVSLPGTAAIARSLALDEKASATHLRYLQEALTGRFRLVDCTDRGSLIRALGDPRLPLAYFYCHGRTKVQADLEVPYLEIGEDVQIDPGSFGAWWESEAWGLDHWQDTAPLVFLNGCGTATLSPDDVVAFVEALAGLNVAGVVGTEIPVSQAVAGEVALRFYTQFAGSRGLSVGEALWRTRLDLLRKGNVAGLVYTPYCSLDLTLHHRPSNTTEDQT